jgi:2-methylcitrate dehydratase PrpD
MEGKMVSTQTQNDSTMILSEFASDAAYESLPPNVVELSKRVLLDTIGVMLAATTLEKAVLPIIKLVQEGGGNEESTLIGFGGKVPCWNAAFANGALSHALDYSSSDSRGVAPGGAIVPAALAMAERIPQTSGKQLITAIAVGSEVVMRIGAAIHRNPMEFGWLSPMLLGVFGAAVTSGKIAGLGPRQMMDAMGIALHQAGGTWEMAEDPASTFRAVRNCFVNQTGVLAALLAQEGLSAARDPLGGKYGLYRQYFKGEYDPSVLIEGLGTEFRFEAISFKPYPSCRDTHTSIDAALRLARQHDVVPEQVEEILLTVGPMGEKLLIPREQRCRPQTSIEAKFSLPFTVATALARRKVTLTEFTPSGLTDPEVLSLAGRVSYRIGKGSPGVDPGIVDIRLKNGRVLHEEVVNPPGGPQSPLSQEDLIEKFRDCADYSLKPLRSSDVDAIIAYIRDLEHQTNLSELMKWVS